MSQDSLITRSGQHHGCITFIELQGHVAKSLQPHGDLERGGEGQAEWQALHGHETPRPSPSGKTTPKRTRHLLACALLVNLGFASLLATGVHAEAVAKGLLIRKDNPGSSDELATAQEFLALERFARVTNVTPAGGGSVIRLNNNQLVEVLEYFNPAVETVMTPEQIAALRARPPALGALATKYPGAYRLLAAEGGRIQTALQVLDQGKVLVAGAWKNKEEMEGSATAEAESLTTTTESGETRTYTGIKVTGKDPDALKIMHSGGAAAIPFDQLTAEDQKKYGFNAEEAAAFRKQKEMAAADSPTAPSKPAMLPAMESREELRARVERENPDTDAATLQLLEKDQWESAGRTAAVIIDEVDTMFKNDYQVVELARVTALASRVKDASAVLPNDEALLKLNQLLAALVTAQDSLAKAQLAGDAAAKASAGALERAKAMARQGTSDIDFGNAQQHLKDKNNLLSSARAEVESATKEAGSAQRSVMDFVTRYKRERAEAQSLLTETMRQDERDRVAAQREASMKTAYPSYAKWLEGIKEGVSTRESDNESINRIRELLAEGTPSSWKQSVLEKNKLYSVDDGHGSFSIGQRMNNLILAKNTDGIPFALLQLPDPSLLDGIRFTGEPLIHCVGRYTGDQAVTMTSGAEKTFPVFQASLIVGWNATITELITIRFANSTADEMAAAAASSNPSESDVGAKTEDTQSGKPMAVVGTGPEQPAAPHEPAVASAMESRAESRARILRARIDRENTDADATIPEGMELDQDGVAEKAAALPKQKEMAETPSSGSVKELLAGEWIEAQPEKGELGTFQRKIELSEDGTARVFMRSDYPAKDGNLAEWTLAYERPWRVTNSKYADTGKPFRGFEIDGIVGTSFGELSSVYVLGDDAKIFKTSNSEVIRAAFLGGTMLDPAKNRAAREIREQDLENSTEFRRGGDPSESPGEGFPWMLTFVLALVTLGGYGIAYLGHRCQSCGTAWALSEKGTYIEGSEQIWKTVSERVSAGTSSSHDVRRDRPFTRERLLRVYRCKVCNHEKAVRSTRDKENR